MSTELRLQNKNIKCSWNFISAPFANAPRHVVPLTNELKREHLNQTCITYNGQGFSHKDRKRGSYAFEFFTFYDFLLLFQVFLDLLQVDFSKVLKSRAERASMSDRANNEVARSTCFAWMDLNFIINLRGEKWLTYAVLRAATNSTRSPIGQSRMTLPESFRPVNFAPNRCEKSFKMAQPTGSPNLPWFRVFFT